LAGELEGGKSTVAIDPERAFDRRPLPARMIVILAGVSMNLVFAVFAYTGVFATSGLERIATTQVDTVYADSLPAGARALTTLKRGDRIDAVNGRAVATWDDLIEELVSAPVPLHLTVSGRVAPVEVDLPRGDVRARAALVQALEPYSAPVLKNV